MIQSLSFLEWRNSMENLKSHPKVTEALKFMEKNPYMQLAIEGHHTDETARMLRNHHVSKDLLINLNEAR